MTTRKGPHAKTREWMRAPCPYCGARPGIACRSQWGKVIPPHKARRKARA